MNASNKKISAVQLLRLILQIVFFIFIPGLFVNVFSDIKLILMAIAGRHFTFAGYWPQLLESVPVLVVTVFFGRFFCGWMCAFGTMGDLIHLLSKRVFGLTGRINEKTDRALKVVKYAILGLIVLVGWGFGSTIFTGASPWNVFGLLADFTRVPDVAFALTQYTLGFFLLVGIMIGSALVERFFCRYLCPLGAVFALASRLKIIKVRKPMNQCGSCRACTTSCSLGIPLYRDDKIGSGECINCYQCMPACPRKNVSLDLTGEDIRPLAAGVLAVAVMTSTYYSSTIGTDVYASTTGSSASQLQTMLSSNSYRDGTYEGSAAGFRRGITTVSVTVQNNRITDIQVISHGDDAPYFNRAYSSVASEILASQSTDVDVVSGATFSSNGIMDAVADALKNAQ